MVGKFRVSSNVLQFGIVFDFQRKLIRESPYYRFDERYDYRIYSALFVYIITCKSHVAAFYQIDVCHLLNLTIPSQSLSFYGRLPISY